LRLKIKLAGLMCDQEPDMSELLTKEPAAAPHQAPKPANTFRIRA
jgi:hypothetical protein